MAAQLESDLFFTSMITDQIGQHKVLLPLIITRSLYNVSMVIKTKVVIG